MNTLISPNQPRPLLPTTHQSSHRIPATVKPIFASLSSSKGRYTKVYAEGRSGRGFSSSGPSKQEVGPTKSPATNEEDELSPEVINRIMRRILVYVGLPMGGGLGMLQLLGFLEENHIWEAPLWVSFITSFVAFGGSALGVPFGALSASWEADKKGSLLGFEEASYNWVRMWDEDTD